MEECSLIVYKFTPKRRFYLIWLNVSQLPDIKSRGKEHIKFVLTLTPFDNHKVMSLVIF